MVILVPKVPDRVDPTQQSLCEIIMEVENGPLDDHFPLQRGGFLRP